MALARAAIAFLFTDLEGSTRLWEADASRMATVIAGHDELCREAVEAHRGRIVKTTGDGLYAVFDDALDGVGAALRLQQGIQALGREHGLALKLRCGLHAGEAVARAGEYFGPAVNCAARVTSAAHGGQVLVTQALVDLLGARRPADADLVHLGRVRLRDVASPVDVWQLLHPDLRRRFPPLRSLDSIPNNLPQQTTSFIGRERDLAEVLERLRAARLVTLTGAGGSGKTRLALQAAASVIESYLDGVWLVELAAVTDPSLVAYALANVLGVAADAGTSIAEALARHLGSRQALIVIDNAEHVLASCAQLADGVMRRCPGVRLLASSREPLGISGEAVYRVPSLSTPHPGVAATPEGLAHFDAVKLFVARARAHVPGFDITGHNATAVASVCIRLDGMPLALELAAARIASMTVEDVDRRLDQRFRLLTGGSRTALPRQQTLRSLIDWSYDLLTPAEKTLLNRMSVFADGWTLAGAEGVGAVGEIDTGDILDLLSSLVQKSLVTATEHDGAMRYRMLETIRQYARDRLLESGEARVTRDLHLAFFAALGKEAAPRLAGADAQGWLDRLEAEIDSLRAALEWSLTGGDPEVGLRLAVSLGWFFFVRGYLEDGRGFLTRLLDAAPDAPERLRASAMNAAGILAGQRGDNAAARDLHRRSLTIFRAHDQRLSIAATLNNIGIIAENEGDRAEARAMYEEALAIMRQFGDREKIAAALANIGSIRLASGEHEAAQALFEEALAIQRELGDRKRIATSLLSLARIALHRGDPTASAGLADEALAAAQALGDRVVIAEAIEQYASLAIGLGQYERAARLGGCAERLREDIGLWQGAGGTLDERTRELAQLRYALADEAFAAAWRQGRALDLESAVRYARAGDAGRTEGADASVPGS